MYGQGNQEGWMPEGPRQFQGGPPMHSGMPFDGGDGGQPWQQQQLPPQQQFGGPMMMQEQMPYGQRAPVEPQQGFQQGGYPGGGMGPTQPQQWGQPPPNAGPQMTNPNTAGTWGPGGPTGAGPSNAWQPEPGNPFQGNLNMGGRDPSYGGPGMMQQQGIPQQYQQNPANAPWQQSAPSQGWNPNEGKGNMQQQPLPPQIGGPSPRPYSQQEPSLSHSSPLVSEARVWVGKITQLIPPNYGIIDGDSFYVTPVVVGRVPQVGEPVRVEAIPNTDGGKYAWRCIRVEAVGAESHGLSRPSPGHPVVSPALHPQQAGPALRPGPQVAAGSAAFRLQAKKPIARVPQMSKLPARGDFPSQPPLPPSSKESPAKDGANSNEKSGPAKYNQMAPPTNQYMAEIATAIAQNVVDTIKIAPPQVFEAAAKRSTIFGGAQTKAQLDEEARRRSQEALRNIAAYGDAGGVGVKMLANMGFGAAGMGLGRNEQGISAPVEAKELLTGAGLGFEKRRKSPPRDRRRAPPRRRSRGRSLSHDRRSASRSRSRDRSPHSRAYRCDPPKFPPFEASRGIPALSKRYKNLYIPSDFCRLHAHWVDSLPDHRPLPITHAFGFKLGKMEEEEAASLAAARLISRSTLAEDEITTARFWSAKVILMSGMPERLLYAEDAEGYRHPSRKLQFLVGKRGKSETMPIGGAWEPCDGAHPELDTSVLIKTATRSFREATGLDLSLCAKWHKFAEYTYLRAADKKKGIAEHLEKSVVFLVEGGPLAQPDTSAADSLAKAEAAEAEEAAAKAALDAAAEAAQAAEKAAEEMGSKEQPEAATEDEALEPGSLTVAQLQEELTKRSLDTKWNPLKGKKELLERLQEWLESKKKAREAQAQEYDDAQANKKAAEEAVEAEKEAREAYKVAKASTRTSAKLLADPPPLEMIEVRVNKDFLGKKERFAVLPMTLESLLEYTEDDKKELTFEVSTLGELLHDMLDTHFGRALLRGLAVVEQKMEEAKAKKAAEKAAEKAAKADKAAKEAEEEAATRAAIGADAKSGQETAAEDTIANGDNVRGDDAGPPAEPNSMQTEPESQANGHRKQEANEKADTEMPDVPAEEAIVPEDMEQPPLPAEDDAVKDVTAATDAKSTKKDDATKSGRPGKKPRKLTSAQRKKAEAAAKKEAKEKEATEAVKSTQAVSEEAAKKPADAATAAATAATLEADKGTSKAARKEAVLKDTPEMAEEEKFAQQGAKAANESVAEAAVMLLEEPYSSHRKRSAEDESTPGSSKRQRTDADWGAGLEEEGGEPFSVACRWFDRECKGYIRDEDLEEISFMVSEGISRKRVQTLVDTVTRSRMFSYMEYASMPVPAALPPLDSLWGSLGEISNVEGGTWSQGGDVAALERRLVALDAPRKEAEAKLAETAKELETLRKDQQELIEQKEVLESLVAKQTPELERALELKTTSSAAIMKAMAELDVANGAVQKVQTELSSLSAVLSAPSFSES